MTWISSAADAVKAVFYYFPDNSRSPLLGVVVGSLISFAFQLWTNRRQRKREEKQDRERKIALAVSILVKAMRIYSYILGIKIYVDKAQEQRVVYKLDEAMTWQVLQPVTAGQPNVIFTDEDCAFIIDILPFSFATVMPMADIYNNLLEVVRIYSENRIELLNLMPIQTVDGPIAMHELTGEELARHRHRILHVQSLADTIVARASSDLAQASDVFTLVKAACVARFGVEIPDLRLAGPT